jgi:hypothetical protein
MNSRIKVLLAEIKDREGELEEALKIYEKQFFYKVEGTKISFDKFVQDAHRELKIDLIPWLLNSDLRNVISAPLIYPMIILFLLLDIFISFFQFICFALYKIPYVKRSDYIVVDRHHLKYLNSIEKINCMYCGYVNGLISYTRKIVARTEQCWCPIKHARKVLDPHRRYFKYSDFGDSEQYQQHIVTMRDGFIDKNKIE